nr:protein fmp52-2, mitochondrial [Quercus suber]
MGCFLGSDSKDCSCNVFCRGGKARSLEAQKRNSLPTLSTQPCMTSHRSPRLYDCLRSSPPYCHPRPARPSPPSRVASPQRNTPGSTTSSKPIQQHGDHCISTLSPVPSVVFNAVGTTIGSAGSVAEQWSIDHDLCVENARAAKAAGVKTYVFCSSAGTSGALSPFALTPYAKMKRRVEKQIKDLGFENAIILRPGMILGRENPRNKWLESVFHGMKRFGQGFQDKWAQDQAIIGRAAVAAVRLVEEGKAPVKFWILDNRILSPATLGIRNGALPDTDLWEAFHSFLEQARMSKSVDDDGMATARPNHQASWERVPALRRPPHPSMSARSTAHAASATRSASCSAGSTCTKRRKGGDGSGGEAARQQEVSQLAARGTLEAHIDARTPPPASTFPPTLPSHVSTGRVDSVYKSGAGLSFEWRGNEQMEQGNRTAAWGEQERT